ncbi:MAG: gliding motility-associated-like protein [Paraglaciecola sp.]
MQYLKITLLFLIALFSAFTLRATHIVGGEMTYTCLGNNDYEITLTVFRDCYNGEPPFDDPAAIGIFNANNVLLSFELINFDPMINDTLDPVLSNDCFVAPPDVCVHRTIYQTTINLPPIAGDYQLAYQRCCRNVTIVNLVDPLDVGATFGVTISEEALDECDSSPIFNFYPPIFICVNEPIFFDQSASDLDGDSIVYQLCAPLSGVTPDNPLPQPPNNPPYPEVPYLSPPYGVDNMLNGLPGGDPLMINPVTGILTGTPNTIGQFVVGVCAKAYRDGELISTIRRDFQYNVGICGVATSAFFAPEIQCDNLTVEFENESILADDYFWIFGDPNNPDDTSSLANPQFTYSDTGTFTITLIAEPGTSCVDTATAQITLLPDSIIPEIEFEITECSDSMVIEVANLTIDTSSEIIDWQWILTGDLGLIDTSSLQNPSFIVNYSTIVTLSLMATAANGCVKIYEEDFTVELLEDELVADTLQVCAGQNVALNPPPFVPNASYLWSPSETLNGADFINPIATPLETTTYTVTITEGNCEIERSVTVIVPEPVQAILPADFETCEPILELTVQTNTGIEFFWATDVNFDDVIAEDSTVLVEPFGTTTYYVLIRDANGCAVVDSVTINGLGINTQLSTPPLICLGETLEMSVQNLDTEDGLTYFWYPEFYVQNGQNTNAVTVEPVNPGLQYIFVEMENQNGCLRTDSVEIGVIDTLEQANFISFQQCGGFTIQFTNMSSNAPFYSWDFGDSTNPNSTSMDDNPTYTYPQEGTYFVTLMLPTDVDCPDTLIQAIQVIDPLIEVDFSYEITECSDSIVIAFTDESTNGQSDFSDWNWQFSDGQSSDSQNPTLTFLENQNLVALFQITSSDGCVDTISQLIIIELITINLMDTVFVCPDEMTGLNPNPDLNYNYEWSPPTGLNNVNSPNPLANPLETTTYSVTISNEGDTACEIVREVTAVVLPDVDLQVSNDTTICADEILLTAVSADAISIQWSDTSNFTTILSENFELTAMPTGETAYFIEVENEFGCKNQDTILITNGQLNVFAADTFQVCLGDTLRLFIENLNPNDGATYQWSPSENIVADGNTAAPLVEPNSDGIFTVDVTNIYGCTTTETVEVPTSSTIPPINITPVLDTIFVGDTLQLEATFDAGYTYFWSPTNTLGFPFFDYNPEAFPTETTEYELFIQDNDGCSNIALATVVVLDRNCTDPFIFIPTGFSPNGNGKNEFIQVFGNNIDEMELHIYNRWGEQVFESFDQSDKWDGTFKGEALPPDVYGFYLSVRCFDEERYVKKGNITLVR